MPLHVFMFKNHSTIQNYLFRVAGMGEWEIRGIFDFWRLSFEFGFWDREIGGQGDFNALFMSLHIFMFKNHSTIQNSTIQNYLFQEAGIG
ncbi:MAG: hypothetical protein R2784_10750 [Saprospiraceae bacterium]